MILFQYLYSLFTHININDKGKVKITFNKNTAPAKYSNVKLYVVLYNETKMNDMNALINPWTEFNRPNLHK